MQHSEIQEQVSLYALGGLAADESARVAQHLDVCPACRALLSEYQFVAGELLEHVPPAAVPARVGVRVLNLAAADAKRDAVFEKQRVGENKRARFWEDKLLLPRWAFALLAGILLLLFGAAGVWAWQLQQSNAQAMQVQQLFAARNLKYVAIKSQDAAADDKGYLCLTAQNSMGLLWLHNLAPLDHDHVYQVWLRDNMTRANGGTFRADYDGRAVAVIQAPRPLGEYQEIGITIEPVGGSIAPTTPRVFVGKLE
jgi:anti-sigma-K factor RskA